MFEKMKSVWKKEKSLKKNQKSQNKFSELEII